MAPRTTSSHEAAQIVMQHCIHRKAQVADQPILNVADAQETARIKSVGDPPRQPIPLDQVLQRADSIFDNRVRMDHPRFFGMIPSPASNYSWIGEMLNTAYNSNAACWYLGSGVSAIETSLIRWAADQIGLPATAGGCFVSGGSMANLTALAAARDEMLTYEQRPDAVIYCSEQTHCSNAKALRILGFGDHQLHKIPTDSNNRIRADLLQAAIARHRQQGKRPFCLMATCGTTNTGSIDPIARLSTITRTEGMWLHVDGAYGASVALSKSHKSLVAELSYCDSLSWDFHKWTFQTYGCALLLVRDRRHLRQSFATGGDYLQDAGQEVDEYPNFWNYGTEMSRPARGMKLWFSLQMIGLDKIGEMLDHGFTLSKTVESTLSRLTHWEIVSRAQLGIVCFRYKPPGLQGAQLDDLNKRISKACIQTNLCAPLTTQLGGCTVLRICSISPDLAVSDMQDIISGLDAIAQAMTEELYMETATSVIDLLETTSEKGKHRADSISPGQTRHVSASLHHHQRAISQGIAVVI